MRIQTHDRTSIWLDPQFPVTPNAGTECAWTVSFSRTAAIKEEKGNRKTAVLRETPEHDRFQIRESSQRLMNLESAATHGQDTEMQEDSVSRLSGNPSVSRGSLQRSDTRLNGGFYAQPLLEPSWPSDRYATHQRIARQERSCSWLSHR